MGCLVLALTLLHIARTLDRMIAAINLDGGTGSVIGYSLGGRNDILAAVKEALAPVRSLGANQFTTDAKISMDTFDFLLEGIPTLVPNIQSPNSTPGLESTSGAYDETAIDALKRQVAIAAVSAYALSDTEARVGVEAIARTGRAIASEHRPRQANEGRKYLVGLGKRQTRSSTIARPLRRSLPVQIDFTLSRQPCMARRRRDQRNCRNLSVRLGLQRLLMLAYNR